MIIVVEQSINTVLNTHSHRWLGWQELGRAPLALEGGEAARKRVRQMLGVGAVFTRDGDGAVGVDVALTRVDEFARHFATTSREVDNFG